MRDGLPGIVSVAIQLDQVEGPHEHALSFVFQRRISSKQAIPSSSPQATTSPRIAITILPARSAIPFAKYALTSSLLDAAGGAP
jgi:hypothetical protein